MSFRIARILLIAALVLSIGLHWAVLQSAAWVGMIVTYSQQGGVESAIARTFDGEHPCALCKLVEQGTQKKKQTEQKSEGLKKIDLMVAAILRFVAPEFPRATPESNSARMIARYDAPPLPPPRAV